MSRITIIGDDHLQFAEHTLNDDEGFVAVPYQDTKGIWTVGYGFNLETTPMPRAVANLWKTLLVEHIDGRLSEKYGYYDKLTDVRKSVLINMGYQLGLAGLGKFKNMHKALMTRDIEKACEEMKDSKWYRNHKIRADRLIYMMRFNTLASREQVRRYHDE